jgi:hypothetical protein
MKTILPFFTLLFLSATSTAQSSYYTISGKVLDATTQNPMQAASVFAQNTTMGTATDAEGNFKLYLTDGGYDLVVTFTGYETVSRRISTTNEADKNILITIRKKESVMEDVVIKSSNEVKDGWEKYGDFFLENFIGKTDNSKQCKITNKEVLKFYFNKRKNRLKVLATAPIEMENQALGYKLKYTLDSFTHEFATQASIYTGYPLFEEMKPADETQSTSWMGNRQKAYKGSMLHFMRSVYHRVLKEEGFEIQFVAKYNDQETSVKVNNFYGALNYRKDDTTQLVEIIPNQPDVAVLYNKEEPDSGYISINDETPKKFQLSVINIANNESIAIEQNGYFFDQNDITITGYWTWKKIGDMLPYDYQAKAPIP